MKTSNRKNTFQFTGFIIAFIGAILFSSKAIIVKKAFADIHVAPLALLAVRMLLSLPFYIIAAIASSSNLKNIPFTKRDWVFVCVTGMLGYYVSSLLDFLGLQYVSAGMERLILFLYPTFVVLINAYLFRQKVSRTQALALIITYAGILLAFSGEMNMVDANPSFFWGCLLVLICAVTYSIYLVGSGRLIPKIGASKFTAYAMLAAGTGVLLHYLITNGNVAVLWNREMLMYGSLLAVIATVIPTFLLSFAMKNIGANNTAIMTSIGPVSTILQAHWILGEPIFARQIAGTVFVVTGVLLTGWKTTDVTTSN